MNRVPDAFPVNSNSFLDTYEYDKQYLFGHQYLPNQSQTARVLAGSILDPFDILKGKEVPKEMKDYNDQTILRAKTLTYFDKELGMKVPLRLESMGGPGGKPLKAIAPIIPSGIEFPEVMVFVPSGIDMTPNMRSWTNRERYYYAVGDGSYNQLRSSGYANYLSQGGETIPAMQSIIDQHRRETPYRNSQGRFQKKPPKPPSETTPQKPPRAVAVGEGLGFDDEPGPTPIRTGVGQGRPNNITTRPSPERTGMDEYKDESAYNERAEAERVSAEDMKIRKLTNRKLFDRLVKGSYKNLDTKASTIKKDLYDNKGGADWVRDYIRKNGDPQNQQELRIMIKEWDMVYTPPGKNIDFKDYPAVKGINPTKTTNTTNTYQDSVDFINNYDVNNETKESAVKLKKAIKNYLSKKELTKNKSNENRFKNKLLDDKINKILSSGGVDL